MLYHMQQLYLELVEKWLCRLKMAHIIFILKKETYPHANFNAVGIPQLDHVKYLGLHFCRQKKHIFDESLKQM